MRAVLYLGAIIDRTSQLWKRITKHVFLKKFTPLFLYIQIVRIFSGAIYVDPRATVILSACTAAYNSARCVLGGDDLFLRGLLLPVYGSVGVAGTAFICPNPSTLRVAGSSLNLVYRDCPPPVIPFVGGAYHVGTEAQLRYAMSQGDWIVLDADVVLTSPLPAVRSQLRLTGGKCSTPGNGTCRFSISGGNAFRIFRVQSSELWLENLLLVGGWGQPTIGHVADSDGSGGAVSLINSVGTFVNVVFANHNATGNGGAVFATGGSVNFTRCLFTGNKAGASGGALYLDSVVTMVNCTVTKNTAGGDGGAVSLAVSSTGHFSGCLFDSNVAGLTAGAVYTGPKATSRFDLCAFTNNVAQDGLDMYIKVSGTLFFVRNQKNRMLAAPESGKDVSRSADCGASVMVQSPSLLESRKFGTLPMLDSTCSFKADGFGDSISAVSSRKHPLRKPLNTTLKETASFQKGRRSSKGLQTLSPDAFRSPLEESPLLSFQQT